MRACDFIELLAFKKLLNKIVDIASMILQKEMSCCLCQCRGMNGGMTEEFFLISWKILSKLFLNKRNRFV